MAFRIGDVISDFIGSKNRYRQQTPKVDPNAYQYGGQPGGADAAANRYRQQAEGAQQRQGEQVNYGQADQDRAMGMQSRGLGMEARGNEMGIANMMAARARGEVPSIAQMQADRQMQQATAAQASAAASARGPAAMALAQQNAAGNTAALQSNISGQAQINAAQERMAAEQNAMGAYGQIRGGDMSMRGQDLANQAQSAQQAQFQSQLNQQQRAQNDSYDIAKTNAEMGVRNAQLTAQMNEQAQKSANALGAGQINAGVSGQNAATAGSMGMGAIGTGASIGASIATGGGGTPPPKAKGGPVAGRKPYLVGEEGPELIIPKQDGHVIPAGPTATILALMGNARAVGGPVQAGGAPSTWGGVVATPEQVADMQLAQDQYAKTAEQSQLLAKTETPWEREARQLAALRATHPELYTRKPTGETDGLSDAQREKNAKAVLRSAKGAQAEPEEKYDPEEKAAVVEGKAAPPAASPKKFGAADAVLQLGDFAKKQAANIDTGYHGPTQLPTAHLLALPGRALGGPVEAGGAVDIGSGGAGISRSQVLQASTGRTGNGMMPVGGGGLVGGTGVPGGGGAMAMSPLARLFSGFAPRAAGGDVDGGGDVLPLYEPPGKMLQQSADGHAYYANDAGADDGRPSIESTARSSGKGSPAEVVMSLSKPPSQKTQRSMTDAELMQWADALKTRMASDHAARMADGPAVAREEGGPVKAGGETKVEIGPAVLESTGSPEEEAKQRREAGTVAPAVHPLPPTPAEIEEELAQRRAAGVVAPEVHPLPLAPPPPMRGEDRVSLPIVRRPAPNETKLTAEEERDFQTWKQHYAPNDPGYDYDYRGAFKAGLKPDQNKHWPDTFKKPNHPTFSNESQYAVGEDAWKAGRWAGEKFIPPPKDLGERAPVFVMMQTPKPATMGRVMSTPARRKR